jgi:hypothetical protein
VAVVSGDRQPAVEAAAREAGIGRVVAEVFPEGKVEEVRRLQAMGRKVAFVGDGVNDAPALAQADLGIALGTGTDVAMEAGHVLVMGGDLRLVAVCLELAKRTYWVIAQNLAWAFGYNILMIPLALVGKVSPLVAAAAMAGSSVTVVTNALRLRRLGGGAPDTRAARERRAPASQPANVGPGDGQTEPPRRDLRSILFGDPVTSHDEATGDPQPGPGGETGPTVATGRHPQEVSPRVETSLSAFAREEGRRMGRLLERLWANQWDY